MRRYSPKTIGFGLVVRSDRTGPEHARVVVAHMRLTEGDIIEQPSVDGTGPHVVAAARYRPPTGSPGGKGLAKTCAHVQAARRWDVPWWKAAWRDVVGWPKRPIPVQGRHCTVKEPQPATETPKKAAYAYGERARFTNQSLRP